jgi:hypothetical protein
MTSLPWTIVAPEQVLPGEARAFFVTAGQVAGFAKPGRNQPPVSEHPRAAHEKIAADLAFELGLPVPPAVLWERKGVVSGQERYVSVSALPFERPASWRDVLRLPAEAARLLPKLELAASAMAPFDSWLGNGDRVNAGNLVLQEDPSNGDPQVTYLDFANALSRAWLPHQTWPTVMAIHCYPLGGAANLAVMSQVVDRIEHLDTRIIEEVVNRVPQGFSSNPCREVIVKGLLHRQRCLRMAMKKANPSLP